MIVSGGVPVAGRGPEGSRVVAVGPGAPTQTAAATISLLPRRAIRRCPCITGVPTVLYPLAHVPVHIVQPEGIRSERSHRQRISEYLPRPPVNPVLSYLVPPTVRRLAPRPCCVFPLRFAQQPVLCPPLSRVSHATYACASFQLTLATGCRPFLVQLLALHPPALTHVSHSASVTS